MKLIILTDNINEIAQDGELKNSIKATTKSVGELSGNINKILEDKQTQEILTNMDEISKNLADISSYVNDFTQDEKLKTDITGTISNINKITKDVNNALGQINTMSDKEKCSINSIISDAAVTTRNLKVFSEKLNKRFLLFRLMF